MGGKGFMSNNIEVLLAGCGYMGREYAKVLKGLDIIPVVIGRSAAGVNQFKEITGLKALVGGLENTLTELTKIPEYAIIATPIAELVPNTIGLIKKGVKKILVEKPAGICVEDIRKILKYATEYNAKVYVAYNRRFYASTDKAREIILEDGGVTSFYFEFTEWAEKIENINNPQIEKENWLLANSSHVIDLAFFLGGNPVEMVSYVAGKLSWHQNGAIYAGAGKTDKGALFSYHANWDAPGRWAVELMTQKHRLYFKPIEKLGIQEKNSIVINEVKIDDSLDVKYKPGLYNQVREFLSPNDREDQRLLPIDEHLKNMEIYTDIAMIRH